MVKEQLPKSGHDQGDGSKPKKEGDVSELIIEGVAVERVNEYKYLGTVLDNKLTFECNTNYIVKKCHQRNVRCERLCICFIVALLNMF